MKRSLVIYLALSSLAFAPPQGTEQYAAFRPHMQSLYASLVQVIGVLLKSEENLTAKDRQAMELQFRNLADQSTSIASLAAKGDKGHQVLSEELAKDSKEAYSRFQSGHFSQARFYLSDMVNACFSCHTSRGRESDSQFAVDFNKDVKWDQFEPIAKARFLALSRQFDAAGKEYEKLFSGKDLSVDDIVNLDPLVEYMILGIRVRNDVPSVLRTFQSMRFDDLPELIKKDLRSWTRILKEEASRKTRGDVLSEARRQLKLAKADAEYPHDRVPLVRYIMASRLLQQVLSSKNISSSEKAEAYYNLGICESVVGSNIFADESLAYFEESIRLMPHSEQAKKSYTQFEEILLYGFSGSAGTQLPQNERKKLDEMKRLAY